jgi:class 3 adenylate cyclase/pimeloyl-ACP methyl ester carboxylesterase
MGLARSAAARRPPARRRGPRTSCSAARWAVNATFGASAGRDFRRLDARRHPARLGQAGDDLDARRVAGQDTHVEQRDTFYARTPDGVYLAYQVVGDGPIDFVWQPDWPGNIDMEWEFSSTRAGITGLANFGRVIIHDHRGVGLSSRNVPIPNLETRTADALAVLDAIGSPSPILVGILASGGVNAMLAATNPERVGALVWVDPAPRTARGPDYAWGRTEEDLAAENDAFGLWGTAAYGEAFVAFEAANNNPQPDSDIRLWAKASRNACTPDVAIELEAMWAQTDVRGVLPAVSAPTLILAHAARGPAVDEARYTASLISGAELHEIPGEPWSARAIEAMMEKIRRFAGVDRLPFGLETVLGTVLFTDIVDSTHMQARLGDAEWRSVIGRHHSLVRNALDRWRGEEADTAGDGFFATFDGPARAVRCALEIVDGVRELGLQVRAGVHTGECEVLDGKMVGISVSTGARVAAMAGPSQVLVSQTVKDLVAGSRLEFQDAGDHELKGIPGSWHLYEATSS